MPKSPLVPRSSGPLKASPPIKTDRPRSQGPQLPSNSGQSSQQSPQAGPSHRRIRRRTRRPAAPQPPRPGSPRPRNCPSGVKASNCVPGGIPPGRRYPQTWPAAGWPAAPAASTPCRRDPDRSTTAGRSDRCVPNRGTGVLPVMPWPRAGSLVYSRAGSLVYRIGTGGRLVGRALPIQRPSQRSLLPVNGGHRAYRRAVWPARTPFRRRSAVRPATIVPPLCCKLPQRAKLKNRIPTNQVLVNFIVTPFDQG